MSPLQLFTAGVLLNINSGHSGIEGILNETNIENYGIDVEDALPVDDEDYQVNIPRIEIDLTAEQKRYLEANCDPLAGNGDEAFQQCKQILHRLLGVQNLHEHEN